MANTVIQFKKGNDNVYPNNAFVSEYKVTGSYEYTLPNDSMYLVIVNAGGNDYGGIELLNAYNGTIYHTSIKTNPYASFSFSGLKMTVSVQYTNAIRIIRL